MDKKRRCRIIMIAIMILSVIIIASVIAVIVHYSVLHRDTRFIHYNGDRYRYRDDISTLLVIGIDDNDDEEESSLDNFYRNSSQADFLLLVVFDKTAKSYKVIQINRDSMASIRTYDIMGDYAGTNIAQISLSHTYGDGGESSCEDTVYAVSNLLFGIDVDNYISITTDVVPILNDLVGGVDVPIEDDFSGVDDTLVMGRTVHLQGQHALIYIRARRDMVDDDSNEARMRRQHTYLYALEEAMRDSFMDNPSFAVDAYEAVSDHTITNIDVSDIPSLAYEFASYEFEGIVSIEGESSMGERYIEFYVDEEALQELVIREFYEPA